MKTYAIKTSTEQPDGQYVCLESGSYTTLDVCAKFSSEAKALAYVIPENEESVVNILIDKGEFFEV